MFSLPSDIAFQIPSIWPRLNFYAPFLLTEKITSSELHQRKWGEGNDDPVWSQ